MQISKAIEETIEVNFGTPEELMNEINIGRSGAEEDGFLRGNADEKKE